MEFSANPKPKLSFMRRAQKNPPPTALTPASPPLPAPSARGGTSVPDCLLNSADGSTYRALTIQLFLPGSRSMMPAGLWNAVDASSASTPEPAPDAPWAGVPNSEMYRPPARAGPVGVIDASRQTRIASRRTRILWIMGVPP